MRKQYYEVTNLSKLISTPSRPSSQAVDHGFIIGDNSTLDQWPQRHFLGLEEVPCGVCTRQRQAPSLRNICRCQLAHRSGRLCVGRVSDVEEDVGGRAKGHSLQGGRPHLGAKE